MTKNLDKEGLKSIVESYDLFFIDLWGVVHDGIKLHQKAIEVLVEIEKIEKDFVLLTNAPRPNSTVKIFLSKMGMNNKILSKVYTSGQAALNYLKKNYLGESFYHIGPPRDFDLFLDFKENKNNDIRNSAYFICTGLFENQDQDLNYYKELLNNYISRKMICTNPDLIVDRGAKREFCAGSVAMIFEKMGGEVIYFGKPYSEVYNQSIENNNKRILAIGDNLNTDIRGANNLNYDSMIITNGIHKNEIKNEGIDKVVKNYKVKVTYMQSELKW
ncbi:TIGR01459 family HAD-type hydrolase [Candidatus Pelagibacter sp.]|nr:TIGR01459 family HAD-type hydrolase [Candidatus Pelagibacter sp.]